ncbi:MAG: AAA family ATPase [Anaerolineae bacterium]|nr:AAA family ATPase [Anaerolineae bacterium]
MAKFALYLLGPPRLEVDGEPVQISRRKAMALLAYLAVTGESHGRDSLATLLWPEYDQSRARADLRRTLSVLNGTLGAEQLVVDRETAGVNPDADLWVDVVHFRRLLAACDKHGHPAAEACEECVSLLEDAVTLYRDDFMAGFTLSDSSEYDEWQFFQAEELRDALARSLERLVRYYASQGACGSAILHARRWVALDALHEPAHRHLMQLYASAGRRNAALRQYRQCVRILEDELGVPPSEETSALYERIRSERLQPAEEDVTTAAPSPELELQPPSFVQEAEPAEVERGVFVARDRELAQLNGYLGAVLDGHGQMVLVAGEAGSGKTTLVYEFARRAQEISEDLVVVSGNCNAYIGSGAPYLPFREMSNQLAGDIEGGWSRGTITRENARRLWALLPTTIQALLDGGHNLIDAFVPGAALAARIADSSPTHTDWLDHLERIRARRAARDAAPLATQDVLFEQFANVIEALARQRPLLLIIDDAQWADAASIGMLFHLSRRLAGNRILLAITYRPEDVALGRPPGAATEPAGERHPLELVINELQRAFGEIEVNLGRVEGREFVEALLDAYPNRLGEGFRSALYRQTEGHALFTVELLQEMRERGDIVQDDAGYWVKGPSLDWEALPARVEAVIQERVGRLDEGLRGVLEIASVEGERFTAQVVAQVQGAGEREMLRALSQGLSRRHGLVQERGEVRVNGRFVSRYQFSHALFQRYLYNGLSTGERRLLHGEIAAALEEIYRDHTQEIVVDLAHHYAEAEQTEKAIEYALRAGDQARLAYANKGAISHYRRALALLDNLPTDEHRRDWRLRALKGLGQVYLSVGEIAEAGERFQEAITLGQKMGLPPRELVRLYYWLGEVMWWQGRCDEQVRIGKEGLALLGDAGAETLEAALMNDAIGTGYTGLGYTEKWREFIGRAAQLVENLPYSEELRPAYIHIFWVCLDAKDVQGAERWLRLFEQAATACHDLLALGEVHARRGNGLMETGDLRGAIAQFQRALEFFGRAGDIRLKGDALTFMAAAYMALGDIQQAEACARDGLWLSQAAGSAIFTMWSHREISRVLLSRGELDEAKEMAQRALQLSLDTQNRWWKIGALYYLGQVNLLQGDREEAIKGLKKAAILAKPGKVGDYAGAFAVVLSRLEEAVGDPEVFRAYCAYVKKEHGHQHDEPCLSARSADFDKSVGFVQPAELASHACCTQSDFSQWYLEPVSLAEPDGAPSYDDAFTSLSPDWTWHDPFGDCSFEVRDDGLEMRAANGRTLWDLNLSAPRVLRPASGDLVIQVVCTAAGDVPAIGGLLLWKDEKNYLSINLGFWGERQVLFEGCLDSQDIIVGRGLLPGDESTGQQAFLRLERAGDKVNAYCSADGKHWFTVGKTEFPADGPIQVGLCAFGDVERSIYRGVYPDGSAIRFESFQLWDT